MRGVAAIAVMLFHFTQHTPWSIFGNADLAVDLFFCLSGFVIAFSYQGRLRRDMALRTFLRKRLVRLYPMYFLGLLLGAFALLLRIALDESDTGVLRTLGAIALNLAYLPFLGDFAIRLGDTRISGVLFPVNSPAWSLFFEMAVNLSFGIWALRRKDANPTPWLVFGALALIAYVGFTHQPAPGWDLHNFLGGFPRTIFGFFAGVFAYATLEAMRRFLPVVHPVYLLCLLVAVFLPAPHFQHWSAAPWLGCALVLVPSIVAVGAVSGTENPILQKTFDYLGWISYPLYCLHFPVMALFTMTGMGRNYGPAGVALLAAITWAAAHLLSRFVEEPVRARLARLPRP